MPQSLRSKQLLYLPLVRWVYAAIYLCISLFVSWYAAKFLSAILNRLMKRVHPKREFRLRWPLGLLVFYLFLRLAWTLASTVAGRVIVGRISSVLVLISLTWLGMKAIDTVTERTTSRLAETELLAKSVAIHLIRMGSKLALVIVAFLLILAMSEVNLSAAITGLGIGGLAIAFAAQKTIENLFGTVTFVTDRVAKVGDFCRIGQHAGTIQHVGLRSTRMRTVEDSILTLPNGYLVSSTVENVGSRAKILFQHKIELRGRGPKRR
jgi:MscS family membrane protein